MAQTTEFIQMPQRGATSDGETAYEGTPAEDVVEKGGCCKQTEDGRCGCCPQCCYRENIVMMNSVFTCFAMVISLGVLVGLTVTTARPHLGALLFVPGHCTTVSANYTGETNECSCGGRSCIATYPCLRVMVTYNTTEGEIITSILHEEEHVFAYIPQCSYQPLHCSTGHNTLSTDLYKHLWGRTGITFPCYHNANGQGALRKRTRSVMFVLHLLLWPSLCSVVSISLCCVIYYYCCPRSRSYK